jgi:hypothetical protein
MCNVLPTASTISCSASSPSRRACAASAVSGTPPVRTVRTDRALTPVSVAADRRPIDPPPIVQVVVRQRRAVASATDSASSAAAADDEPAVLANTLHNPYYFMFASLAKPDEDVELHWLKDGKTCSTTGSVVSSLYHLKDIENNNVDAGFFVFPDLSVRTEGSYRLKLTLFELVG